MDKNIAALLREDAKTVHVTFDVDVSFSYPVEDDLDEVFPAAQPKGYKAAPVKVKTYTYVTHFDVRPGDVLVVPAAGQIKLVTVQRVDDEVKVEPNSPTQYNWVISKVDMVAHNANETRNIEIETAVADAYRNNLRKSFAQQILAGVGDAQRDRLTALIAPSTLG